ncbi:MAG: hypothetical protein IRY83_03670 [Chloroflexi bacterium]|nr:hypothetical protein [Chloroflexota bacterium]
MQLHLRELLSAGHWFDAMPGPPSDLYLVVLLAFLAWTVIAVAVYRLRRRLFAGNGALIGMGTRFGPYAITIGVIGLLLIAFRYAEVPGLSMRVFLYLTALAALGYIGFLGYYLVRRYPARLAEIRAEELRRRYAPERRRARRRR